MIKGMKIGALWSRKTKEGKVYLSGEMETMFGKVQIVLFPNDKKTSSNHPDYNLVSNGLKLEEYSGSRETKDPLDMGDGIPERNDLDIIQGQDDIQL